MSKSESAATRLFELGVQTRVRVKSAAAYALMFGATLVGFLMIRQDGRALHAPQPTTTAHFGNGGAAVQLEVLLHILLALALIILFARLLGLLFRYIHQPPVIG